MNSEPRLALKRLEMTVGAPLSRFWHWWLGELAALVPARWRRRFEGRERKLLFIQGAFELQEAGNQYRIPLEQCATDPTLATWRTQAAKFTRLLVELSRKELLYKVISLPAATETRLEAALGFELDRHTPFSAEEASFGYRVVKRDRTAQRIEVELFVLPHTKRQRILEALSQAGLVADCLLPEGTERDSQARSTLNLLVEQQKPPVRQTLRSRPVIIVLILALLTGILFYKQEQRLQELEAAVGPREQAAEEARALRAKIEALESGGRYILERRQANPPSLILLNELTQILPDNTWLSRLEVEGNELRIQGESDSASGLIGLLEDSSLLREVGFTSPVTINPRSRKERFSLNARISAASGGVQP